jgi:hypothetical protein
MDKFVTKGLAAREEGKERVLHQEDFFFSRQGAGLLTFVEEEEDDVYYKAEVVKWY